MRTVTVGVLCALVCLAPGPAKASIFVGDLYLLWPQDQSVGIATDSVILVYGPTFGADPVSMLERSGSQRDGASGDSSDHLWLLLSDGGGDAVPVQSSIEAMPGGYFLLTATPELPLNPQAPYTLHLQTPDPEGVSLEQTFTTGAGPSSAEAPSAPDVEYQGLGVVMADPDGSYCLNSEYESGAALAVLFPSMPESSLVRIQVFQADSADESRDSASREQEESVVQSVVFETLLTGYMIQHGIGGMFMAENGQVRLGGFIGWAEFKPASDEHYCVRASVMDAKGTPGLWSPLSCSQKVGWWRCMETILFDEDIPEGVQPESDSYQTEADVGGSSGCAASGQPAVLRESVLLLLVSALLWTLRLGARRVRPEA